MLTCYLDDSDASTGTVLTIAGYVADEEGWGTFEQHADFLCEQMGVDVIHGREFDGRRDCFKGWTVPKSIAFLHGIRAAMLGNVILGMSRSVPKQLYKVRKIQARLDPSLGAFGFAFGTIIFAFFHADEFGMTNAAKEGIRFLVENGNPNNADLARYLEKEIKHGNLPGTTSIGFVDKKSCRAIQLADLYAFYSRRRANRAIKMHGKMTFFPDPFQLHVQDVVPHHTGLIKDPVTEATNLRTGEKFGVTGLVTPI